MTTPLPAGDSSLSRYEKLEEEMTTREEQPSVPKDTGKLPKEMPPTGIGRFAERMKSHRKTIGRLLVGMYVNYVTGTYNRAVENTAPDVEKARAHLNTVKTMLEDKRVARDTAIKHAKQDLSAHAKPTVKEFHKAEKELHQSKQTMERAQDEMDQAMKKAYPDRAGQDQSDKWSEFSAFKSNNQDEAGLKLSLKDLSDPQNPVDKAKKKWVEAKLAHIASVEKMEKSEFKDIQQLEGKIKTAKAQDGQIEMLHNQKTNSKREVGMASFKAGAEVALKTAGAATVAIGAFVFFTPPLVMFLPVIGIAAVVDAAKYGATKQGFVGLYDHKARPGGKE